MALPILYRLAVGQFYSKKTNPKNLSVKGEISSLAIQALKQIGDGNVRKDEKKRIVEILKKEDREKLKHDIKLAPAWIAKLMKKAVQ